ncbi:UNVERIFIED_CONTAM: hypothetical protein Scaly_2568600 [Sesamum calycinum]|uniref:Aminotransferase-like plant mobile domain-containing protein n=1 Tax=Sesamum calycinum TaxID=2727403 RepID=A0AAW2K1J9_9LAMI
MGSEEESNDGSESNDFKYFVEGDTLNDNWDPLGNKENSLLNLVSLRKRVLKLDFEFVEDRDMNHPDLEVGLIFQNVGVFRKTPNASRSTLEPFTQSSTLTSDNINTCRGRGRGRGMAIQLNRDRGRGRTNGPLTGYVVYFKDISTPFGVQHLVILDDEKQPEEKGMVLMAHTPLIGRYASQWPRLTNPLYTEQWSREVPLNKTSKVWSLQATNHHRFNEPSILPTLGRRMIEGKAKRGDAIQFFVEFRYIKGFREWTKDILSRCEHKLVTAQAFCEAWCPSTNTLLTSFGELSISFWDLHTLDGFPINGLVYDEVVPCAKELDGVDETGWRFVPRSCKFLFHAYHLLQESNGSDQFSQVPVDKWIKFWFKRATKYCKPPPCKEKKAVRPKLTHNPSGTFVAHGKWSSAEEALFSKLGLEGSLKRRNVLGSILSVLALHLRPSY